MTGIDDDFAEDGPEDDDGDHQAAPQPASPAQPADVPDQQADPPADG